LAGSYGDSIGRAEYASRRVTNLLDMRDKIKNPNGFLKKSILNVYKDDIDQDINFYWNKFPQKESYQQLEQDYQIHYMRRKLNPCLSVINEKIPLFQVFTDPEVFGFMWSIHPKLRNNEIYKIILNNFKTDLSKIPWARTGLIFDQTKGQPDTYSKNYHAYSEHINIDLNDYIKELVLSKNIEKMNILNLSSIENYFKLMKQKFYLRNIKVEEKIIWLASLSLSIDLYNINENYFDTRFNFYDKLNSLNPIKENLLDQAKNFYINSVRNR
jgi:asparagine synthase (glutamine-hydrolysing)